MGAFTDLLALLRGGIGGADEEEETETMGVRQLYTTDNLAFLASIVEPDAQNGTASWAAVAGSEIDARPFDSLAYTIVASTNSIDWRVIGANSSDYSDGVIVQASETLAAAAIGSFTAVPPPFAYYRVEMKNTGGSTGSGLVRGIAK